MAVDWGLSRSCWQVSVPLHLGLSIGLLDLPHIIAAVSVSQRSNIQEKKAASILSLCLETGTASNLMLFYSWKQLLNLPRFKVPVKRRGVLNSRRNISRSSSQCNHISQWKERQRMSDVWCTICLLTPSWWIISFKT